MAYTVYCLTNKINNKKYVGVTSQRPHDRWQNGKHYERHRRLYADVLKYGWDNFEKEILFENLTPEQAAEKEKELIKEWDLKNKGYNCSKGGEVPRLTQSAIEKLRERNTGAGNPFYNRKHTEETKQLIKKNRPKKGVVCVDTGIVYPSTREAERQTGAYHGDISKCCNGKIRIAGGYVWKYV
jgi:group I intron endonuclease